MLLLFVRFGFTFLVLMKSASRRFGTFLKRQAFRDQMKEVVEKYSGLSLNLAAGADPETMIDQVTMAMEAVYASWDFAAGQVKIVQHRSLLSLVALM